ncbi:hypothetical protein QFZ64_000705 [Streptomyces sp. B3I8]|nr:hypothetical protein [Streptomyces sp. B3I8]
MTSSSGCGAITRTRLLGRLSRSVASKGQDMVVIGAH